LEKKPIQKQWIDGAKRMTAEVTICICTFGHGWKFKGREAAERLPLLHDATLVLMHDIDGDLCSTRNAALEEVKTEYVIFLDADDSLADNYIEEMIKGTADIRVPSVSYVSHGVGLAPYVPRVSACRHDGPCGPACLPLGNYLVIGSMARTEALRAVGGFRDWPMYEDWDLWARCYLNGATFENIPDAVYLAAVRPDSRNRQPSKAAKLEAHRAIAKDLGFPVP
jgi:glycosyltransferase involved in cell wall biosynthesis